MPRIKAQCGGNGRTLAKRCNAEPGHWGRSLWAGDWAAIRGVAVA